MSQEEPILTVEDEKTAGQLAGKVAKGGGILFAGSFIGRGANFLIQILLGRILKAKSYGTYGLAFTVTSTVRSISFLGLHHGVVRFGAIYRAAGDKDRIKGTVIAALLISLLVSAFSGILLFAFAELIAIRIFDDPDLTWAIRIFSITLPLGSFIVMIASTARAFHLMQYDTGLRSIFPQILNVLMLGLVALLGYRLNGAVMAFLVSRIFTAIVGLYVLFRIFPAISSKLKAAYEVPKLIKFSLPLMIADVAKWLLTRLDRLMLGSMRSSSEVGIYNAGALTASYTFFILRSLGDSFSPMISTLYSEGKEKQLGQLFQTVTRWIFALSLPITLILILFSKDIILLFGSDFETGRRILIVHSIAYLMAVGVGPVGFMLVMSGRQNIELLNTFAVLGLNTALNFWLIRLYGGMGAAIATGISISLVNMMRLLEVMVFMKMQPFNRKYMKPLFAGLIMVLLSWLVKLLPSMEFIWVLYSGILVLLYGGLLYLMGFEEEDRAIFSMVKNKVKSIGS